MTSDFWVSAAVKGYTVHNGVACIDHVWQAADQTAMVRRCALQKVAVRSSGCYRGVQPCPAHSPILDATAMNDSVRRWYCAVEPSRVALYHHEAGDWQQKTETVAAKMVVAVHGMSMVV